MRRLRGQIEHCILIAQAHNINTQGPVVTAEMAECVHKVFLACYW